MKRVSFEVAKAIKEAGYPQGDKNSGLTDVYPLEDHDDNVIPYTRIGKLTTNYHCQTFRILSDIPFVVAPTYLEVWLWLWKEKGIYISVERIFTTEGVRVSCSVSYGVNIYLLKYRLNPEAAIIAAIEYLVKQNLIK